MKRLAFLALCLIAAGCHRDGDGSPGPHIPGPSGNPPIWGDVIVPEEPYGGANDPPVESACVPDPEPEAVPTPIDDDGGADIGDPGFTITVTPESFNIPPGGSIDLAVTVTRVGDFAEAIDVTVDGLPPGVTASPLALAPDECECEHTITLVSDVGMATPHTNAARVRGNAVSGTRSVPIGMTVRGTAGSIDPSFGTGGNLSLSGDLAGITDMEAQADGKLLFTGGGWEGETLVCRIDANGVRDSAFGSSNGCQRFDFAEPMRGTRLRLLPDGRILVLARGYDWTDERAALARLMPDGEPDSSFGEGGIVTLNLMDGVIATDMIRVGGKVVVAGRQVVDSVYNSWAVRLDAEGTKDGTFGTYGRIVFPGAGVRLDRRGECGFVAVTGDQLHAFNWAGDKDPSFGGGDGAVALPFAGEAITVASGEYFIASPHMEVVRVSDAGALGPAYLEGLPAAVDHTNDIAILPDGAIVLAGQVSTDTPWMAMARRLPDGSPDSGFADGGVWANYNVVGDASALVVIRDGRYVVAGPYGYDGMIYRVWD